jgi:signal transduction histidine kinase/ligand-binding sensor domain-containing protein
VLVRAALGALGIVLVLASPARALDPSARLSQYGHGQVKGSRAVLSNVITALAGSEEGYVWIGADNGLGRWDGDRVVAWTEKDHPYLAGGVTALATSPGAVWIGTRRGLLSYRDHRFVPVSAGEKVELLHVDRGGRLWVQTATTLFTGPIDGRLTPFPAIAHCVALLEARDGTMWFATPDLMRLRGGQLEVVDRQHRSVALAEDRAGTIWVGATDELLRVDGNRLLRAAVPPLPESVPITSLRFDRDGNAWLGTPSDGLLRYAHGRFEALPAGSLPALATMQVNQIFEDAVGFLLVATDGGGLIRLRDGEFVTFGTEQGLSDSAAAAVAAGRDGGVWVATAKGVNHILDGVVTSFDERHGLQATEATAVYEDPSGTLWVGTTAGLYRRDGEAFRKREIPGLEDKAVTAIAATADGSLWVATRNALLRLRGDRVESYGADSGLRDGRITTLKPSASGALWIGTIADGLCRFADETLRCLREADGAPRTAILAIHEDRTGALWLATPEIGLVRFRDQRFTVFGREQGLEDAFLGVMEDAGGYLWASSYNGIHRFPEGDLERLAHGGEGRAHPVVYTLADGLRSVLAAPGGARSLDGRLWFPTANGVSVVDPVRADREPPPVRVLFEALEWEAKPIGLDPARTLRLPGPGPVSVRYTALGSTWPKRVEFRHRLEGYDHGLQHDGWRRTLDFPDLPAGSYRLHVEARTPGARWREAAELAFVVPPRFYQSWWFRGAWLAAAGALVFAVYRLRVARLVTHERELQALVVARTADLEIAKLSLEDTNATLEARVAAGIEKLREAERLAAYGQMVAGVAHEVRQPLFAVSTMAYVLAEQLGDRADLLPQVTLLRNQTKRMSAIMEELLDFAKPATLLPSRTRAAELFADAVDTFRAEAPDSRLALEVTIDAAVPPLFVDRARMLQVLLNLMHNARKHGAGVTRVALAAAPAAPGGDRARVALAVENDGAAIAPELVPRLFEPFFTTGKGAGLGLAIARRFVDAHGGTITVTSAAAATRFVITVPVEP